MENGRPGTIYNVCSGEGISLQWILDTMREISGVTISVERDESRVRKADIPYLVGDNSRLRDLGWDRTIPIRDTLRDLMSGWGSGLS
jgi:GDP-4-dehydro-6-deoxy-D-mannose reductase